MSKALFAAAVAAVSMWASQAGAAIMVADYYGTVSNVSDASNFLGLGTSFTGQAFHAHFVYDTTIGQVQQVSLADGSAAETRLRNTTLFSTDNPMLSATLDITGASQVLNMLGALGEVDLDYPGFIEHISRTVTSQIDGNVRILRVRLDSPVGFLYPINAPYSASGYTGTDDFRFTDKTGAVDVSGLLVSNSVNVFRLDSPPVPPTSPVPEPSAWALLILGFAAVGAQLRRPDRRSSSPPAYGYVTSMDAPVSKSTLPPPSIMVVFSVG